MKYKTINFGSIGNYYGCLEVCKLPNKEGIETWHWGIEDYDGTTYEEIPNYLVGSLLRFKLDKIEKNGITENDTMYYGEDSGIITFLKSKLERLESE